MDSVKPTTGGLKAIQKPHDQTTEYAIDGIENARVRVGKKGKLSYSVMHWDAESGKRMRLALNLEGIASKNGIRKAIIDAIDSAEIAAQDSGYATVSIVGNRIIESGDLATRTKSNYRAALKQLLAQLGDELTDDPDTLLAAHRAIMQKHGSTQANTCMKFYRRILTFSDAAYGTEQKWPAAAMGTLKMWAKEKPRDRRAKMSDIRLIWHAGSKMPEPWGRLMRFYLVTGVRNSEAFDGHVEDGDFVIDGQYTKNGETHRLPMTYNMIMEYDEGFGDIRHGRGVTKYLERATGIHLTPHDFRRTFASICEMAGVPSHSIGALLNHNQSKSITSRYIGSSREMLLAALHLFDAKLKELIEGKPLDHDPFALWD